MFTSQSPLCFSERYDTHEPAQSIEELASAAQLLDDLLPNAKMESERELCPELIKRYRAEAEALLSRAWSEDKGQDIAEYAVMLAAILVIVIGTVRLVGSNANNVFSQVASSVQ